MFRYEKPLFEKKRLLRIEMLEQLRDYPRDYLEILYSGYSDGIVCGCTLSWNEEELMITPVIIKFGFHDMVRKNRPSTYACVNLLEAYAPEDIQDRSICIGADCGKVIKELLAMNKNK